MTKKVLFSTEMNEQAKKYQSYLSKIFSKYVDLDNANLLEIGCGNGRFGVILGDRVKSYSGIDPDKEYVTLARKTSPKNDYRIGFAEKIPFKKKFDILLYINSWHFIQDYSKAFDEAVRVLKEGGIIAIIEPLEHDFGWASPVLNRGTPEFNEEALKRKFSQLRKGRKAILENDLIKIVEEDIKRSRLCILKLS